MPGRAAAPLLSDLLAGSVAGARAVPDAPIRGLTLDSREVRAGWLFLAVPGAAQDGRRYIREAVARGAAAVLFEADPGMETPEANVPVIAVTDLKQRVGLIADRFFGAPSHRLSVIGVTGTNGKTTCTQLLAQALDAPGRRCALIGTLGTGFPDALDHSIHTTPDAVRVHALLADFVRSGAVTVCMEVSSHALDQGRVTGVAFELALLTNLSRDHLDYHATMEAYGAAKARLFECAGLKRAVINQDDPFGRALLHRLAGRQAVTGYGIAQGEIRALDVMPTPQGLALRIATPAGEVALRSALLGRFNAENLVAVLACLLALGLAPEAAAARLARAKPVAGRMERFGGDGRPQVIVDYAHSPDALEKVLRALREHTAGRLWCVFGCGGERDRGKRPQMGRIAEALADEVILTDDNPRREDPDGIIEEIAAGMSARPAVVRDRAAAIRRALEGARAGDVVLVAGKGHEEYQQVGDTRQPYSDRDTVRTLLEAAA